MQENCKGKQVRGLEDTTLDLDASRALCEEAKQKHIKRGSPRKFGKAIGVISLEPLMERMIFADCLQIVCRPQQLGPSVSYVPRLDAVPQLPQQSPEM